MARTSVVDVGSDRPGALGIVRLLLLREGASAPRAVPPWVAPAVGLSILVFLVGLLVSLGQFGGRNDVVGLSSLAAPTLVRLVANPFDPFVVWSCLAFYAAVRNGPAGRVPRAARWGLLMGFCGYALTLKVVMFGLGGMVP